MTNSKIAVIGDKDSVLVFKALGIDVYDATTYFESSDLLKELAKEYKIIFITDDIAEQINTTIDRYADKAYPAIIPIPSALGSNGFGLRQLSSYVEKAVGIDILNINK